MAARDWVQWHCGYAHPASSLSRRLRGVQEQIRAITNPGLPA